MSDLKHIGQRYEVISKDGTSFDVWFITSSKDYGGEAQRPVIVHLHGGGYVSGGFNGDFDPGRFRLKQLPLDFLHDTDFCLLSVQYRLAPKNPFPAALDDAYAAVIWAQSSGAELNIDTNRMFILGISAGGGLGISLVAKARDEKLSPPLCGLMTIYPMVDPSSQRKWSLWDCKRWYEMSLINWAWSAYLSHDTHERNGESKYAVPMSQNLEGFPSTYLDVGTEDLFCEEVKKLGDKFQQANVSYQIKIWERMGHDFESSKDEKVLKLVTEAQSARMTWFKDA